LFKKALADGADVDLANQTLEGTSAPIKAVLVSSTYTYNAAHDFRDDLTGVIATSSALSSTTWSSSGTGYVFDAADITFSAVAGGSTVDAVVLFFDTGTPGTSPLICYDQVTSTATNGGDITITFNASGIFTVD